MQPGAKKLRSGYDVLAPTVPVTLRISLRSLDTVEYRRHFRCHSHGILRQISGNLLDGVVPHSAI